MTDYVALQPITTASGALAHNPGDPVPAANVQQQGYVVGEQVADVESEQAATVLRGLGILPAADQAEAEPTQPVEQVSAGTFDPDGHNVADVNDYLDRYPDDVDRVIKAETAGRHRAGIVHGPHGTAPDVAEG